MPGTVTKLTAAIGLSMALITSAATDLTGFPPCDALISAGLGDRVLFATSAAYEARVQSWWSANARLRPWCFVQPQTTQEVSIAIKALADTGSGAVRSGGHSYPGSNNIANGVTIDLGMMNHSSYDPVRGLASLEPGAAWKDVYFNLLQNGNVTVTGGRDGGVGVGGFLLGGGNSYYAGRNGLACDTVVNYEVVLANGSIVQANTDENPALWKALKGGGLNFGIVTRFNVLAMPAIDLAYGQTVIASNYSNEVVDAVVDFTNQPEGSGDDALIVVYISDTDVRNDTTILAIRANTKGNLNTTSFDKINKVPNLQNTWERMSLADAANSSQVAAGTNFQPKLANDLALLSRNVGVTLTFLNSPSVLRQAAILHGQLVSSLSSTIGPETFGVQSFFQPFPTYFNSVGQSRGGGGGGKNVLGLEHISSNAILWTSGIYI